MMGGKAAAETMLELRSAGDYSSSNTKRYEQRWMKAYGNDFYWSQAFAEAVFKHPILLDAVANEVQRKGDSMMACWAEVATNLRPKTYFFRPDVAIPLLFALLREYWAQHVGQRPDMYAMTDKQKVDLQGLGESPLNGVGLNGVDVKSNGSSPVKSPKGKAAAAEGAV